VLHHQESTMMQYDLRQRAICLGWAPEAIEVIDEDQARTGTTLEGAKWVQPYGRRHGVRRGRGSVRGRSVTNGAGVGGLAAAVDSMRGAGVAVVDEQRIYDPNDYDDKLLLELKGTMSEAERHWLRRRLHGARQHKARRGALKMPASTGYQWGEQGFAMDPD
jgi:hypothetical protein